MFSNINKQVKKHARIFSIQSKFHREGKRNYLEFQWKVLNILSLIVWIIYDFWMNLDVFLIITFSGLQESSRGENKMSCARPPNLILRKQKSLVCESVCQPTANTRERRLRLHKQYSIDQSRDTISAHRSANGNQLKNGHLANNSWNCNNLPPEASLRIFTAIKNKNSQNNNGREPNEEYVFTSCYIVIHATVSHVLAFSYIGCVRQWTVLSFTINVSECTPSGPLNWLTPA